MKTDFFGVNERISEGKEMSRPLADGSDSVLICRYS
jgi:hypothetical protein